MTPAISLNAPGRGGTEEWRVEMIPDPDADTAAGLEASETAREATAAMAEVLAVASDDRERDIIRSRIVSTYVEGLTEVGQRWGVSRERIRQIEQDIRRRLIAAGYPVGMTSTRVRRARTA